MPIPGEPGVGRPGCVHGAGQGHPYGRVGEPATASRVSGRLVLAILFGLALAAASGSAAPPELTDSLCGKFQADGPCWLPIDGQAACGTWWSGFEHSDMSSSFEGRINCEAGLLSGSGTLTVRGLSDSWQRYEGAFVDGRMEGPFEWLSHDGSRGRTDYRQGVRHGVEEVHSADGLHVVANHVLGELHGKRVVTYANGRRVEEHYDEDRRHGLEIEVFPNGDREERTWREDRPYRGSPWTIRDKEGTILVSATVVDGKTTAIDLPSARLPSADPPSGDRAPLDGAFGIDFGPDGFEQVKALTCQVRPDGRLKDVPCDDRVFRSLVNQIWTVRRTSVLERSSSFVTATVWLKVPPRPIAGAREYNITVNPYLGVSSAEVEFWMPPSDPSSGRLAGCRDEEERLEALLIGKYGQCRDFLDDGREWPRIGQCDAIDLPMRIVRLDCTFRDSGWRFDEPTVVLDLEYEVLTESHRRELQDRWAKHAKPTADEL